MHKFILWSISVFCLATLVSCTNKAPATWIIPGNGRQFDGAIFSKAGNYLLSHEKDSKSVDLWEVAQQKVIHQYSMTDKIMVFTFSPEEGQVLTCAHTECTLWDKDAEKSIWSQTAIPKDDSLYPDEWQAGFVTKPNLIWVKDKNDLTFFDRSTGKPAPSIAIAQDRSSILISPNEDSYLSRPWDKNGIVLSSFEGTTKFQISPDMGRTAVFSTDGSKLIVVKESPVGHYTISGIDITSGQEQVLAEHTVSSALLQRGDGIFSFPTSGKYLELWDADPDHKFYFNLWEFDLTTFSLTKRAEHFDHPQCISAKANFMLFLDPLDNKITGDPNTQFTVTIRDKSPFVLDETHLDDLIKNRSLPPEFCQFSADEQYVVSPLYNENGDLGVWDLSGLYP